MPVPDSVTSLGFRLDELAARRTLRFAGARRAVHARMFPSWAPDEASPLAGRYLVGRVLGQGAFGTVSLAHDRELDRAVALKVLHGGCSDDATIGRRDVLAAEARALARVSHPNVVAVFDVGVCDGRTYLAMEYVPGCNLRRFLSEKHAAAQRLPLVVQAGRGLAAAHEAGIVHRDFKPENVLVGLDGRVRVGDFGLARSIAGHVTEDDVAHAMLPREASRIAGTPVYMAPEVLGGTPADRRSDQYAFFVCVYEAAYGVRPYEAPTVSQLRKLALRGPGRAPVAPELPPRLFAVIERGLAPDPDRRFPDMHAAVAALVAALQPNRRSRWWLGVIAAPLVGVALFGSRPAWRPAETAADRAEHCRAEASALANVWSVDRRRAVWRATISSGRPHAITGWPRVEDRIDRFAAAWTREHEAACASGASASGALGCLARRRSDLDAVLAALEQRGSHPCATELLRLIGSPTRCREGSDEGVDVEDFVAIVERAAEIGELVCGYARDEADLERARAFTELAEPHPAASSAAWALFGAALDQVRGGEASVSAYEHAYARADPHDTGNRVAAAAALAIVRAPVDVPEAQRWAREATSLASRAGALEERCQAAHAVGRVTVETGDYAGAERAALEAIEICGADSLEAGDLYGVLGSIAGQQQRHAEGLRWAELRHELVSRNWGRDDPRFASAELELGNDWPQVADADARSSVARAIAIFERTLGHEHHDTRWARSRMAVVELRAGAPERAREILEAEWAAEQRRPASDDAGRRIYYLNSLASVYGALGDSEREQELHQRSLDHALEWLGDHPLLGGALSNTARTLRRAGRLDEALARFEQAIEVIDRILGPTTPLLAYPLAGRAQTLSDLGREAEALVEYERALAIVSTGGDELGTAVIAGHVAVRLPADERARAVELANRALPALRAAGSRYASSIAALEKLLAVEARTGTSRTESL